MKNERRCRISSIFSPGVIDEHAWSNQISKKIINSAKSAAPLTLTWLNHYTSLIAQKSGLDYKRFDLVGVDGILLRHILTKSDLPRTSADLVLPYILKSPASLRIGIIGSTPDGLKVALEAIEKVKHPSNTVVFARDGYGTLPSAADLLGTSGPIDIIILGLGAPKQDVYALDLASAPERPSVVMTCGGWLDQISDDSYYPALAYKLKLNWLVRLAREPRRLWRRYTVDAIRAVRTKSATRQWMMTLDGLGRYEVACKTNEPQ